MGIAGKKRVRGLQEESDWHERKQDKKTTIARKVEEVKKEVHKQENGATGHE